MVTMMKKVLAMVLVLALCLTGVTATAVFAGGGAAMTPEEAKAADLPAFPGAEGGGKYTTGGRGGEVYHVTNLNDDGAGSLRDAVSQPNRTVVFDVSGTIHLKSALNMSQPNITLAGQTAPGDGICVGDYNLVIAADNIIIRYLRFRPGDISHDENDAVWARYQKDIIMDHCSTSWSTDETLSLYGVANTTVQWCIASESLTLAVHAKGRHGYGGIWGGANVTYHHNLVATHTSRTPRYASKSSAHPDYVGIDGNDMVNNVIYNWGFNSAYGAEEATVNMVNNYYKPGPITNELVRSRLFNPSKGGRFYISGNVLEGNAGVTRDNMQGVEPAENAGEITYLNSPDYEHLIPMDQTDSAEEAYSKVLSGAGATLPKRDSYDARIVNDVKNGTGRAVNNESEAGGWPELAQAAEHVDSDGDGMPDSYEEAQGLDKSDPSDGSGIAADGYTNLEHYLNALVENASEPQNPDVELNMEDNTLIDYGKEITLTATAAAAQGRSIARVEFFDGDEKLGSTDKAPYTVTTALEEGTHYLSARAVDSMGEAASSAVKSLHVNYNGAVKPWTGIDIGETVLPGAYAYQDGVYIVKSTGLIGAGNEFNEALGDSGADSFSYLCQPIDTYGEISAKLESVSKLNNNCKTGLMIRDGLEENSDFVMLNYEYEKGGAGLSFVYRTDGSYQKEFLKLEALPRYLRLLKEEGKVSGYHSDNGVDWIPFGTAELPFGKEVYAGAAVDGNQETNEISNYTWGRFGELTLQNYGENDVPDVALKLGASRYLLGETVSVSVSSADEESSRAELYVDGALRESDTTLPFSFELTGLEAGPHWITAKVYDSRGASDSKSMSIGVSSLADGWQVTDLNPAVYAGSAEMTDDTVTIYGAGFGLDEAAKEQFPYLYRDVTGDFRAEFQISGQNMREYDQLGMMARDSLEAGAQSYALYFQPYNGEYLKKSAGADEKYTQLGQQKYKKQPVWLRLERRGSQLSASYSEDGMKWTVVAQEETELGDACYFGLWAATAEEMLCTPFTVSGFTFTQGGGYTDMDGYEWARDAVETLTASGVISGTGESRFEPNRPVTRAEFVKMLAGVSDFMDPAAVCGFADVPPEEWYAAYVASAANAGIVQGVTAQAFAPNQPITRQEMAEMLYRILKPDLSDGAAADGIAFADIETVDLWAREAVEALGQNKILLGENGFFIPFQNLTRAEAAQAVYQASLLAK